ncbi:MAG: class I SAM-dependent methyltransferase [Candidatus Dormibacteraceae bacterium]
MTALPDPAIVKSCCASAYASDWATVLLGDSMHPGGDALTERTGELIGLAPTDHVIDVASGRGRSAMILARRFGCTVTGVDYSPAAVAQAERAAQLAGLHDRLAFRTGDAESLPFGAGYFAAAICECAFCTFPSKAAAAAELARVVRPGGAVAISDLTRRAPLPPVLDGLLGWVACIGDARPEEEYASLLVEAGLVVELVERHDAALAELVGTIRMRLLGAEVAAKVKRMDLPGVDWPAARRMAAAADAAVRDGSLGYAVIVARRPKR